MSPFLRIGFSNFEIDPSLAYYEEVLNPYCAVYMKEAVDTGQWLLVATATVIFSITTKVDLKLLPAYFMLSDGFYNKEFN